jgi:hypothetical protein
MGEIHHCKKEGMQRGSAVEGEEMGVENISEYRGNPF